MSLFRLTTLAYYCANVLVVGGLLLASPTLIAHQKDQPHQHEHEHDDDFTSPGTHVHGLATLTIVLEGNEAMVALQSAAYNIVGFEHAPNNNEQHQEIAAALEILREGNWFTINPEAGCELSEADANTDLTAKVSSKHADFYANISLICQQPARFNELTVGLFNLVPSLEKITVQWVINGQQGATELSLAGNAVIF
jgi:hypothetical protein